MSNNGIFLKKKKVEKTQKNNLYNFYRWKTWFYEVYAPFWHVFSFDFQTIFLYFSISPLLCKTLQNPLNIAWKPQKKINSAQSHKNLPKKSVQNRRKKKLQKLFNLHFFLWFDMQNQSGAGHIIRPGKWSGLAGHGCPPHKKKVPSCYYSCSHLSPSFLRPPHARPYIWVTEPELAPLSAAKKT